MRSWCDQTFESEEVKCLFGASALFMAHAPDDAGGAELAWLFSTVLQDAGNNLVKGGMHHVALALADHLRSLGGEIRTSAGVEKILVGSGRATGVRLKRDAHSPLDLERKLSSAAHGTICHGAMLPYQTGSMRPIPEMGDYRSPVENVYLCGSGSHPGPGVSMAPGRNAAETIFSDLGLDFGTTVATGATRS
jgi:phytoene dehydrogenase-like protein